MRLPEHPSSSRLCISTTPDFRENRQDQLCSCSSNRGLTLELFLRLKVNPSLTGGMSSLSGWHCTGSTRVETRVDYCSARQGQISLILSPPFLLASSLITVASSLLSPHLPASHYSSYSSISLWCQSYGSTVFLQPHFSLSSSLPSCSSMHNLKSCAQVLQQCVLCLTGHISSCL